MYQVSRPLMNLRSLARQVFSDGYRGEPPSVELARLMARTDEVGELARMIHSATQGQSKA
jgi:hypothetical protein